MKKKIISIILCFAMVVTTVGVVSFAHIEKAEAKTEVKAMWVAFCDFSSLGLTNKNKTTFTANIDKMLNKAKYYGTNTIYFHVRAFDDASWKSNTFKASNYLNTHASSSKTAAQTYTYDPLSVVIQEAHERGIKIEAWMNPYRVTYNSFLSPKSSNSTKRINRAIDELQKYDLDGIHFDDYFYNSKSKYIPLSSASVYHINPKPSSKLTSKLPSAATKRANVNRMIVSVYKNVHQKSGWKFGISPAGNYENCMNGGADVKTWLSKSGYIDYLAPQIYWTDNWGSRGTTKMFTTRLKQFKSLNTSNKDMYIGLALYMTRHSTSSDRGWAKSYTNIRTQVKLLRKYGMEGYALFSAADLYDSHASAELYKLKGLVNPIYAKSINFKSSSKGWIGKGISTKLVWTPTNTNPKGVTYKSSNTSIATVNSSGIVTGKKAGTVTITAKTKNGKITTLTKKIRTCKVQVTHTTYSRRGVGIKYSKSTKYKKGENLYITKSKSNWGKIKGTNKWIYMKNTKRLSK